MARQGIHLERKIFTKYPHALFRLSGHPCNRQVLDIGEEELHEGTVLPNLPSLMIMTFSCNTSIEEEEEEEGSIEDELRAAASSFAK